MTELKVYVNGMLYLSGNPTGSPKKLFGSYYGSSTRIGEIGTVFCPDSDIHYPDLDIKIVKVEDGIETVLYNGTLNVKDFSISIIQKEIENLDDSLFEDDILENIKQKYLNQIEDIKMGLYCPLKSLDKIKISDEQNIHLFFRDLHRFGNCVEIAGITCD